MCFQLKKSVKAVIKKSLVSEYIRNLILNLIFTVRLFTPFYTFKIKMSHSRACNGFLFLPPSTSSVFHLQKQDLSKLKLFRAGFTFFNNSDKVLHTFSTLRYCLLDILRLPAWLTWYTRTSSCINCVCASFKIGQPLQKNSLNAIRLWFNCSLISMDKANVLHRVITANDCSERGAVCVC